MPNFNKKLKFIAGKTDLYLKRFLLNQKKKSELIKPMKYGLFSGGKKFRSSIVVNTGKIFGIDYSKLIAVSAAVECMHSYSFGC